MTPSQPLLMSVCLCFAVAGSACQGPSMSSKAPPMVVCGTTLYDFPMGRPLEDATSARTLDVLDNQPVYLRFTTSCEHGVRVDTVPGVSVVKTANADDGELAAAALNIPATGSTNLTVRPADGQPFVVTIKRPQ